MKIYIKTVFPDQTIEREVAVENANRAKQLIDVLKVATRATKTNRPSIGHPLDCELSYQFNDEQVTAYVTVTK
jgi:hypothetical protein